jgi:predicted sulfurtransferase
MVTAIVTATWAHGSGVRQAAGGHDVTTTTAADRDTAVIDVLDHAEDHKGLIDEAIRYQTDRGNFAQQPEWLNRPDDEPAKPRKRTRSRTRKTTTEP